MPEPPRKSLAIVAALEREVRPLVKNWRMTEREYDGRRFRFFEKDDIVLVCGGIGATAARRAAEAVIVLFAPSTVYSVGFAGALDPRMNVGDVMCPGRVINAGDGSSVALNAEKGALISFGSVASPDQKRNLHQSFGAHAVDMEAASVLRAAEAHGIAFGAVKAISDDSGFDLPPMDRFVDEEGKFSEFRFALFAALRPWIWPQVLRLAANSKRASHALCAYLSDRCVAGKTARL